MPKALITTIPFAQESRVPLEILEGANIEYLINPIGRKLNEEELADMVTDFDAIIAGTETIGTKVMDKAKKLKLISRVGIGLDSVDLLAAKERGINVSYTPDAPAPAVAELTIGLMLNLLRNVQIANSQLHKGEWHRHFGRRIPEICIGILGAGRIGGRVLRRLAAFGSPRLLVNDLDPNLNVAPQLKIEWVEKEKIFAEADLISLHLPLSKATKNLIGRKELTMMKSDAMIINCARGGIINEMDLYQVMQEGHLGGAAIDVFETEPYDGPLKEIERCILTAHMGSMSIDCRSKMEIEATREVARHLTGRPLASPVPDSEYAQRS